MTLKILKPQGNSPYHKPHLHCFLTQRMIFFGGNTKQMGWGGFRHIAIVVNFVVFGFSLSSESQVMSPRIVANEIAKNKFFHLNFFADGRGMHLVPGLIEVMNDFSRTHIGQAKSDKMMSQKWGLVMQNHWPAGLFEENYKGMKIGALGCVACHSSKAAGQYIIGLGNKNIDVLQIGKDALLVESLFKKINPFPRTDPDYRAVQVSALEFANLLSNPKLGNLTQGLVPVSFIRAWFYKQAHVPIPSTLTRGAVKVPSLWGYGEKRKVGQFSDGFGDGTLPGWAVAVELTGGQEPETVRSYESKINEAENLFSDFLPPKYPFPIDNQRAAVGQTVFENTCSRCHGTYKSDGNGLPIYEAPRFIDLRIVNTDSDRLDSNTEDFVRLVDSNPLSDMIRHTNLGRGYFAPRLVGIWARFPYLHNGAIPNVASLLTPAEGRPDLFSLEDAGEFYRYDQFQLGLTVPIKGSAQYERLKSSKERSTYSTNSIGQSNQGHPFGINLSMEEKRNLIEYLKTL